MLSKKTQILSSEANKKLNRLYEIKTTTESKGWIFIKEDLQVLIDGLKDITTADEDYRHGRVNRKFKVLSFHEIPIEVLARQKTIGLLESWRDSIDNVEIEIEQLKKEFEKPQEEKEPIIKYKK